LKIEVVPYRPDDELLREEIDRSAVKINEKRNKIALIP